MEKLPLWNLSDLFTSISDPRINESLEDVSRRAKKFRDDYHLKIKDITSPSKMLEVFKEYESIISLAVKPQAYAELLHSTNTANPEYGAFMQKASTTSAEIFSQLIFFELELTFLPEKEFASFLESVELANYRHYFEKLSAWKKHRLSEKEEQILEFKRLTGKQAFQRLYEQELTKQQFSLEIDGEKKNLNQSEILNILYTSSNQTKRADAAAAFTVGLSEKESILTFVMNTLAEDKKIEDKLLGFEYPEQARHLNNEANRDAVETMVKVVEESYALVQEYYTFKKEVLGLEKMYDYDRYAPVGSKNKSIEFKEAQEIVLGAFSDFDGDFGKIATDFFDKQWIDAAPMTGKRGGAYCEGATPDVHPYVFMNFTGSINDVMTLAHELGHGINFELARKQSIVNYNCPLTLAETASIFAETLAFRKTTENETDKEVLLGMYMQKIESIFASVQRQISMFRFEQDFHNAYRKGGELTAAQINVLWIGRQREMFGNVVSLTANYESWWSYVSHFIRTPFYVYAYAFGELLAFGLLHKAEKKPEQFPGMYREFLEGGGSKSPQELAQIFNIDLEDENFWRSGIETIAEYIKKAKKLKSEL